MRRNILALIAAWAVCMAAWAQDVPAFPGAEGHGRYITGGRGGKIVHVTNLNDSGTGSFREAVKGSDKKIVVFDVGGVIALKSNLNIGANTTIEGQTAPEPGITLRYYTVNPAGNNIIMRFIRIRRGQEKDVNDGADASTARHYTGIMLDHCSFSWSIDEVASFYDNNNFTMQWCTVGESLNNAGHNKGAHGYGGIWGGKLASFHHNMILHVNNRSPRFNGARYNWTGYTGNMLYSQYQWKNAVQAENVDFRNCVIYNCGNGCYGGPGGGQINIVNNYYKTGPAANTSRVTNMSVGSSGNASGYEIYWGMASRYYINGNQVNATPNHDWTNVAYDSGIISRNGRFYCADPNHYHGDDAEYLTIGGTDYVKIQLDEPKAPTGEVTTHTAAKAFEKVLSYAGASLVRDDVDTRYVTEARNGTATYKGSVTKTFGRIDLVSDVNGYTETNFGTGSRAAGYDTDKDGMPDAWETANGLNPNDASDANAYTLDTKKRYTNIEVYCNSLVQDIMVNGTADAEESVKEYYPAYTKADGTKVAAIGAAYVPDPSVGSVVDYTIAQDTYLDSPSAASWNFCTGDITVGNEGNKGYSTGKENGVKYSAGVQYTITLPQNVYINKVEFTGYDNYGEVDAYLSEVAGTEYATTQYVFPQKDASGNYQVVSNAIEFSTPVSGRLTFTPAGKQVVLVIKLTGFIGDTNGIAIPRQQPAVSSTEYYSLDGRRLSAPGQGISIRKSIYTDGTSVTSKIVTR